MRWIVGECFGILSDRVFDERARLVFDGHDMKCIAVNALPDKFVNRALLFKRTIESVCVVEALPGLGLGDLHEHGIILQILPCLNSALPFEVILVLQTDQQSVVAHHVHEHKDDRYVRQKFPHLSKIVHTPEIPRALDCKYGVAGAGVGEKSRDFSPGNVWIKNCLYF